MLAEARRHLDAMLAAGAVTLPSDWRLRRRRALLYQFVGRGTPP